MGIVSSLCQGPCQSRGSASCRALRLMQVWWAMSSIACHILVRPDLLSPVNRGPELERLGNPSVTTGSAHEAQMCAPGSEGRSGSVQWDFSILGAGSPLQSQGSSCNSAVLKTGCSVFQLAWGGVYCGALSSLSLPHENSPHGSMLLSPEALPIFTVLLKTGPK